MNHQSTIDKAQQVRTMFDRLAPRYDLMNRVMTLGQDQRWRKFVVDRAHTENNDMLLDLASGTGDIAFALKKKNPRARVIAADFSLGMLSHGQARRQGDQVHWVACDAMKLPFSDHTFDAVTFGYLLRNVSDIDQALSEVIRVLKPGGRVVCLDTTPPPPGLMRPFITAYLNHGLPLIGRLIAGNACAYTYLSQSTQDFETPQALVAAFERNGFHNIAFKTFMMNTIAIHWADKTSE